MKKAKLFFSALFLTLGLALAAQNIQVKGTVADAASGETIPAASVLVKGTSNGVISDNDGNFAISVAPNASLVVSSIGYRTVEIPVEGRKTINIELQPDIEMLGEVVVTALGISREKKALGYATQAVSSEELLKGAPTDLATAMSGKVSGVNITPSSGMPGASTKITIRGSRSFTGNNTPLYVIDGMPVTSTADLSTGQSVTGSDYSNRALDIDPNDIESINILKGQAASALYGMRAGNGVIVITTKSGKHLAAGKPVITLNSNVTVSTVSTVPEVQTEYAQGNPLSNKYSPSTSLAWGPKIADLPDDPTYGGNTDNAYTQAYGKHEGMYYVPQRASAGLDPWAVPQAYDNIGSFFQRGLTLNNSVSVAQNMGRGDYSFSIGNTHQTGIVPSTGMDRYNAKFSASSKLNRFFTTGVNASFVTSSVSKQTGANDGVTAMVYAAPTNYDLKGIPSHPEGNPYQQLTYRATSGFPAPYWAVENNSFTEKNQRFFGNTYLAFAYPINNAMKIDAKYQLGIDAYTTTFQEIFGYGHKNGKGQIDEMSMTSSSLNSLFTAAFDWNISDDLHFNFLYGNEIVDGNDSFLDAWGQNFNFTGWNNLNNASNYSSGISRSRSRTFGNFANLALDYKNMLFFNATGRYDKVSSMPHGSRGFFYPSVSLGFVFTELEGLKNDVLTFGKIRGSFAEVGMAGSYLAPYYSVPAYGGGFYSLTPLSYPMGSVVAYTPSSTLYNPNLVPQNTRSWEVGTELAFWEGLISLDYTFSRQDVKDQIFSVPLPGSTGSDSFMTNAGSVHTNAHELTLTFNPIRQKDINWDIALNFTKIDNYVDELAEGVESIFLGGFVEPQVRAGIGDKFPVIYGVSYVRDPEGHVVVDEDGLPEIGEEKVIGSVAPDFQLGLTTNLNIYKVNISATFDWKQGGDMYCGTYTMMDYYGVSKRSGEYRNKESFIFDEQPNAVKRVGDGFAPNDIEIPGEYAYYYFNRLNDISESFVHDTSFIKLRDVTVSYPFAIGSKLSLTASAFARNIILWSKLKGFDPEASQGNTNMGGGFERFSLPGASSYGFGLTLKF